MHLEAHAGLGWLIGCLVPGSDRRLRAWCVGAAVLPDVDAVTYLLGEQAYATWHHTFGHNLFLGVLLGLAAGLHGARGRDARRGALVGACAAACFATHLLTDMRLSAYPVHLFWPTGWGDARGQEFTPNWGLGHPLNTALVYASAGVAALLAPWRGVTPLELLSPRLDRIVLAAFRRRPLRCAACARATNLPCDRCQAPVCLRHGRVDLRFRIACPACVPVRAAAE